MIDQDRLRELLEEATMDCYDEEEEFWGIFSTLDDSLIFPLQAKALGESVDVMGLDSSRSSSRRGVMALVRKGDQDYPMALAELEFVDPDSESAEWLAMYKYWLR